MTNTQKQTYCLQPLSEAQQCDKPCNFRRVCLERLSDYIYNNLSYQPEKENQISRDTATHQIAS